MLNTLLLAQKLTGLIGLYTDPGAPATAPVPPVAYLSDAHKLLRPDMLRALGPMITGLDNFADWYQRIEMGSIAKLALSLSASPPSAPLLDRQPLYNKEGNAQNLITKSNRFVGFRLDVQRSSVAVSILRIGIQLSGLVTDLPVYLFRSDQDEPVETFPFSNTSAYRTGWIDCDAKLLQHDEGYYYLIGYYESDLPVGVQAVGAERGFTVSGCSSCLGTDYTLAQNRTGVLSIQPVYSDSVINAVMPVSTLTDVNRQSWGLNLIIDAKCDATNLLLNYRDMLVNALLYTIACDVLEEIATSNRVNGEAAKFRNEAYVALNGQSNTKSDIGLKGEKNKIVDDLRKVMGSLAPDCLKSETPRRGISFGSIFS